MAEPSVTKWNSEDHAVEGTDWEEQSYLEGCAYAREQARRRVTALDDELLGCKPRGLRVEGFRERTLVTRFGEVVVRRRMYSDGCGNTTFALDDHLGWKPRQQASPSLTESIVSIAGEVPPYQVWGRLFRMADEMASELTAGVLSPMTVHRLLDRVRWTRSAIGGSRALREGRSCVRDNSRLMFSTPRRMECGYTCNVRSVHTMRSRAV